MTEKLEVVYGLFHTRSLPDGGEEDRLIGVYGSEERASARQTSLQRQLIFKDAPDGFITGLSLIGEDDWTSGYVTQIC